MSSQDKRDILSKTLDAGEKNGISKRTLDDIWKEVKALEKLKAGTLKARR